MRDDNNSTPDGRDLGGVPSLNTHGGAVNIRLDLDDPERVLAPRPLTLSALLEEFTSRPA